MPKVVLTQELAEQFAGALIAIIRADHEIQPSEGRAVQEIVAELVDGATVDFADVMLMKVSPSSFGHAVRAAAGSAHGDRKVSSVDQITRAFRRAAKRVAGSDGEMSSSELTLLNRFLEGIR